MSDILASRGTAFEVFAHWEGDRGVPTLAATVAIIEVRQRLAVLDAGESVAAGDVLAAAGERVDLLRRAAEARDALAAIDRVAEQFRRAVAIEATRESWGEHIQRAARLLTWREVAAFDVES
jgi:hypothetical protein